MQKRRNEEADPSHDSPNSGESVRDDKKRHGWGVGGVWGEGGGVRGGGTTRG